MMNSKSTGTETIQKMAIALLVAVAAVTVIGLFSFGAGEEVRHAVASTLTGLQLM
jgi:hypothetical protein